MTICRLVRSALAETGSWRGVGRDLESCHGLRKVLLVVLCHTTFEHIGLFVWIVETPLRLSLSCLTTYCHPPWAPTSSSSATNAVNTSCQLNMGHINEAIGMRTDFLYACPAAPPTQPIESGGISKATQAIQRSGLQHHTQCHPAILWLLWPNILPLPKSMTIGAFPWMRRPYQTRMLLIISHPLPGIASAQGVKPNAML